MIRAIKEFLVGFMYGFKIGYRQAIAKRKIAGQMFAVSSTYQLVAVSGVEVSVKLVSNQTLLEAMGHTTACAFTNSAATGGDGAYWIVVGDEFHGATPEVQSLILSHEEGHIFLGHCSCRKSLARNGTSLFGRYARFDRVGSRYARLAGQTRN